jgi:hypothetical protein
MRQNKASRIGKTPPISLKNRDLMKTAAKNLAGLGTAA